MPVTTTHFEACKPSAWLGRYARIPGEMSVFHLKHDSGRKRPAIYWDTDEGRATCFAVECQAEKDLAKAVEAAKQKAGGGNGGSFQINEHGQVLVPSSNGDAIRVVAGQLHGSLLFENPFDSKQPIDLGETSGLVFGDPWKLPYVGMPFRLNASREILFKHSIEDGEERIYPPRQDRSLAMDIFSLRGSACRFIVNPVGVVLTKKQDFEQGGKWSPHYVGEINRANWFKKEEV